MPGGQFPLSRLLAAGSSHTCLRSGNRAPAHLQAPRDQIFYLWGCGTLDEIPGISGEHGWSEAGAERGWGGARLGRSEAGAEVDWGWSRDTLEQREAGATKEQGMPHASGISSLSHRWNIQSLGAWRSVITPCYLQYGLCCPVATSNQSSRASISTHVDPDLAVT